jgi:hypothetical protein
MDTLTPVQILVIVTSIILIIIISLRVTYRQYFANVGHYTIPTLGNIYNNLQKMTVTSGFETEPSSEEPSSEEPSSEEPSSEEPMSKEAFDEPSSEEQNSEEPRSEEDPDQKLANMYKIKKYNLTFPKLKLVSDTRPKKISKQPNLQNILDNLSG